MPRLPRATPVAARIRVSHLRGNSGVVHRAGALDVRELWACRDYRARLRWPHGFVCPTCEGTQAWCTGRGLWMCGSCGHQTSVTAGTLFQDTRTSLVTWFRAVWVGRQPEERRQRAGTATSPRPGQLSNRMDVAAQASTCDGPACGRDLLSGAVEVDETFVGGVEPGGGRRHVGKKALVVIGAEVRGRAVGRIRMRRVVGSSAESLLPFVPEAVEPGAVVITDGLQRYRVLPQLGYSHDRRVLLGSGESADAVLPRVHRVAALLKRWLMGTHQGAVSHQHLDYYLDEFTFRFNRRASRHRGKLFYGSSNRR